MAPENRVAAYEQYQSQEECGIAGRMLHQASDMVKENPASSALLTFGLGLGLGIAVTALLSSPPRRRTASWLESHLPENFSKQVADAVSRMLPDALARRM